MTSRTLAEAITPRTRAVIIVHLYGQMPDMTSLVATARQAGIAVIEDAAQAHGAEWAGRRAGSFGEAGCFSFYPAKNLGAFGDAGAVVTSRPGTGRSDTVTGQPRTVRWRLALRTRSHRHEQPPGCAAGDLALRQACPPRRVDRAPDRAGSSRYQALLGGCEFDGTELRLTATAPLARHVYHLFVVRVLRRDSVRAELTRRGIQTGVHYPVPCHKQPPLRRFADRPLPVAEQAAGEIAVAPDVPAHDRQPGRLRVPVAIGGPAGRSRQAGDRRCPMSTRMRQDTRQGRPTTE